MGGAVAEQDERCPCRRMRQAVPAAILVQEIAVR